jgi:hypothetical protein
LKSGENIWTDKKAKMKKVLSLTTKTAYEFGQTF